MIARERYGTCNAKLISGAWYQLSPLAALA